MTTTHRFEAGHLHGMTRQLFMAAATPRHIADDVAEILVNANLAGHDSHGILRIPYYLDSISSGGIVPDAEPEIIRQTANTLRVDGKGSFGHYTARKAMGWGIQKAKDGGICGVSLLRNNHAGRQGEYAETAARAGCIGIITVGIGTPNSGTTAPFGAAVASLGNNPFAVGIPTGDDTPFVIDFATSVIAGGKIKFAESRGADLPEGCIVDKHGNRSVKTQDFADGGHLLAFGAHKGSAISLLTILLGGLNGDFDAERRRMRGTFMQIINVNAFTPLQTYQHAVRTFLDGIKATKPAPGFDEVLVPGDFERRCRVQRLAEGVEVPDSTLKAIQEWAKKLDVSLTEHMGSGEDVARYR